VPSSEPAVPYKKKLRRTILRIVVAVVLLQAIGAVVGLVLGVASVFFDTNLTQGPLGWLSFIYFFFATPVVFLLVRGKKMFTKDLTAVNGHIKLPDLAELIVLMLAAGSLIAFVQIALAFILQVAGLSLPSGGMPSLSSGPVAFLFIIVIGPICEEIIFRGAILRTLQPYGANFAIVVSALMFGLIHGYLFQAVSAFLVGLILAYCALRFSLKWAMLLHIVNNGVSVALGFDSTGGTLVLILQGVFLVLGIVAFILLCKKFRQQRKEGKAPALPHPTEAGAALASPRPFAIAFTSPWLIVLLLYGAIQSLYLMFFSLPL
jgi:membrane protease YdiL (CAAX protease family)